jgi:hypothetical protein
MHECPRCGYSTKIITNFRKHINNKKTCEPILSDISLIDIRESYAIKKEKPENQHLCEHCGNKYSTYETLRIHKKLCTQSDAKVLINNNENTSINHSLNNNNIQTINNTVNINVREFLKEDHSYLSDDFKIRCASKMNNGLIDFIKSVRFNPQHPENMNIKVHRIKQKTLYIYKNGRWEITDAKWTLEEMIIHGAKILHQTILTHFDQEKLIDCDSLEARTQQWLLSLIPNTNEKIMGMLSKQLYALILDNQLLLMESQYMDDKPEIVLKTLDNVT